MIAALMVLAAVVDLAFCGYRAAAGRNARIEKTRYYAAALITGAIAGVAVSALLAVATAVTLAFAPVYPELVAIGGRMLVVFAVYAALVLGALAIYLLSAHEVRTLATVAILGPFTLIRPAVIAAAAVVGLWPHRSPAAVLLTLAACAAVLATGMALDRAYGRRKLAG